MPAGAISGHARYFIAYIAAINLYRTFEERQVLPLSSRHMPILLNPPSSPAAASFRYFHYAIRSFTSRHIFRYADAVCLYIVPLFSRHAHAVFTRHLSTFCSITSATYSFTLLRCRHYYLLRGLSRKRRRCARSYDVVDFDIMRPSSEKRYERARLCC